MLQAKRWGYGIERLILHAADTGGGGTTGTTPPPATTPGDSNTGGSPGNNPATPPAGGAVQAPQQGNAQAATGAGGQTQPPPAGVAPPPTTQEPPQGQEPNGFKPIQTQAEFDAAVARRLERNKQTTAERIRAELQQEAAVKAGEWQQAYTTLQATTAAQVAEVQLQVEERDKTITRLQTDIAKRDRDALVQKVGTELGLDPELWQFVKADTDKGIRAEVTTLKTKMGAPVAPPTEANGAQTPPAKPGDTPAAPVDTSKRNWAFTPAGGGVGW